MSDTVVLFDLDDTLVEEVASARRALLATAGLAEKRHGVAAEELRAAVLARAKRFWWAHPLHPYAKRIGLSSWEALWARFEGRRPEIVTFRSWAPEYRRSAWTAALRETGVNDPELGAELAERFPVERRALHVPYPEARETLETLRARGVALGLVTNGLSCLQREKLRGAGLEAYFDAVTAGGDHEVAKPDPEIFRRTLDALGGRPDRSVMIGNNPDNDISGARSAGIRAILVRRDAEHPASPEADAVVRDLREALARI